VVELREVSAACRRVPAACPAKITRMERHNRWLVASGVVLAGFMGVRAWSEPGNDFRFCILGDRTGDAQRGVYEGVWHDLDLLHPDFVVNVGDTIQGGNDSTAEAEWRALRPLWERYKYPQYFTPGNHDIWSPESRKIYEKETGRPAYYGFDYQNAHFTVLDNSQTEDLSDDQMEFLARDLAAHKDRDPKFVLFHKPFWLIPVKFQSSHFPFHQLAKKYGVRYVISGHGHQFVRLTEDGIVYLEAGSSGGKLKGEGFEQGWFFGQVFARVSGSKVQMTAKEIGGPPGKGRVFKAEEWGGKN
jgi:3',5'-cyclic-AMP phosphodiesterase